MKKTLVAIAAAALMAATLTGCSAGPSKLQAVYESCGLSEGSTIGDNGTTLSIDTMGDTDYVGASITDLMCVLDDPDLGVPDYVTQAVLETRAIDGRQNEEFDGITMAWAYHPDDGMSITFHKK